MASECKADCVKSWTHMSVIEIKALANTEPIGYEEEVLELKCGSKYGGKGVCDYKSKDVTDCI